MKRILLSMMALLAIAGTSKAQTNSMTVADITLPQKGDAKLTVSFQLDAAGTYTGYSFQLELPSELEFVMAEGTDVACTKGSCHDASHSVTANLSDGLVKVAGLSLSSKPLVGTSGNLLTFTIKPATTLTVGQTFTGSIKNILIVPVDGTKQSLADATFKVTVGAPVGTLLDEDATVAPAAATDVDVRVKRTIKANEWSTICLPFAMTAAQCQAAFGSEVQIADFTGYTYDEAAGSIAVSFSGVSAIEANHPYVIKVAETVSEFKVDGVDVNPQNAEINKGTSRKPKAFIGNYVAGTAVGNGCLFLNGGKFWYSVGTTKIKAFRGFFNFNDLLPDFEDNYAEAPRVSIVIDDMTTAIEGINADNIAPAGTYTLGGLKTECPTKKGVYIVNGKKVVVK